MAKRNVSLVISCLALAVAAGACAPSTAEGPASAAPAAPAVTPELIAQGQTLFAGAGRCGVCHGATARGGRLGPNLTDDEWIWVEPGANMHTQIFDIIKNGIATPRQYPTGMPAMGGGNLTDEQVHALAAYVGSL